MKIDRVRFLLLATTLTTGCVVNEVKDADGGAGAGGTAGSGTGGTGGSGTGGTAGTAGSSGSAGTAGSGTGGTAGSAGSGTGGTAGTAGSGTGTGGTAGSGTGGTAGSGTGGTAGTAGTAGSSGSGGTAGSGGTGGCDDSVGTPADCTPLASSPCYSWGSGYCTGASTNFKPKVAAAAVDCMLGLPTDESCSGTSDPYSCMRDALAGACADSANDTLCDTWVTDCASSATLTATDCHGIVDGLSAAGLAAVTSCMSNTCGSGYGLWPCIESL